MSHNVLITDIKIASLPALRRAIEELAAEGVQVALLDKKTFRTYRGQPTNCDLCISLPGENHDVGLRLQADGSYQPIYDPHGMHRDGTGVSCSLSREEYDSNWAQGYQRSPIGKLVQRYATCVTEDAFAAQGLTYTREFDEATSEMYVIAETL